METTPAFKEWQVVVAALEAGEQTLLLRKGGIAEGRGGFAMRAPRFWLFPTAFHAQREKVKPAAHRWLPPPAPADTAAATAAPATVTLTSFAEAVEHRFLDQWPEVAALAPQHIWTEETVRERFLWSKPAGVHLIVVRVFRLQQAIELPLTPEMGGCKSWIELPLHFNEHAAVPVLDDSAFAARRPFAAPK